MACLIDPVRCPGHRLDLKTDFPPIPPGSPPDKDMGGLGSSTRWCAWSTQSSTLWPWRNMGSV